MIKLFQKLAITHNYTQKFYIEEEAVMRDWVITLVLIGTY